MRDFADINLSIKFTDGIRVDIWSNHSNEYLVEFWDKQKEEYLHMFSLDKFYAFTFYHFTAIRFSSNFHIRVYGWNQEKELPILLAAKTYTHHNKNILLRFSSDRYEDHLSWLLLAKQMEKKYNCQITVSSIFCDRLPNVGMKVVEKYTGEAWHEYDSSYTIGIDESQHQFLDRYDIGRYPKNYNNWSLSSAKYYYSDSHPTFPHGLTPEKLFENILNL